MYNDKDDNCGREATIEELDHIEHLLAKYSMNDTVEIPSEDDISMGFTYPHER
jgi:hypothetical protein